MQDYEKAGIQNKSDKKATEKPRNGEGQKYFEERKEINRNISRLEKKISETELSIEKLEEEMSAVNLKLSATGVLNNTSIFESYDSLQEELNKTLSIWEELHTELENWKSKKTW